MKKYLINTNIIVTFFTVLFLYTFFLYPQSLNSLVTGSYSSIQLIQTQKYILKFIDGLSYPFIFNLGNGFDLIADSPQSVLHPFYIVINLFSENKFLTQSIFVKIHMFLFILGLFIYIKDKINNNFFTILFIASLTNSIAFTGNISHPFFLSVYAYFPFILLTIDKIIEKSSKTHFIFFTILITLMILIGHFQHQFIFLSFLMIYLLKNIIDKKLPFKIFLEILFCIATAFILSLPQLLPVYDLMLAGERSSVGGIGRFSQSLSGLGIAGYFIPGMNLTLYKYFPEYYNLFSTAPSLIEGLHYIGIIPITLFIFLLTKLKNELYGNAIFISIIFLILRSLGIFFFINLLLNYLPLFGQFRAPIRNLYLVDFLIFIFIALNFRNYFSLKEFTNFINNFFKTYLIFIMLVLTLIFFLAFENIYKVEPIDLLVIGFSLIMLTLVNIFLKILKNSNYVFLVLLLIGLVDISFYKYATPLHSKILKLDEAKERISFYDNYCKQENVNSMITIFDHAKIRNDLPRFNYGNKEYNNFLLSKNDEINKISPVGKYISSYNCDISISIKILTLSTYNSNNLNNIFFVNEDFTTADKLYVASLLGFERFISFDNKKLEILSEKYLTKNSYDKKKINKIIRENFLINQISESQLFNYSFNEYIFQKLKKLNLSEWLAHKIINVKSIDNIKFIPYGSARNYIIFDQNENVVEYKIKDPFIQVYTDDPVVKVFYIPTPFIIGLLIIIPLLILNLILRKITFSLIKKFVIKKNNLISRIINQNTNNFNTFIKYLIYLVKIFSHFLIPLTISCLLYLYFLGNYNIQINNELQKTIKYSFFFFFHFLIVIFFILKILKFDKKIISFDYKLHYAVLSILLGMVLWSELTIYETPKYLIEVLGVNQDNVLAIKKIISNFW